MELWELVARERCRDTLAKYTHAGDRFRLDEYVSAFCEDGVLEIRGAEPLVGRAAILERFRGGIGNPASPSEAQSAAGAKRIVRHNVTNVRFESMTPEEASWPATSPSSRTWAQTTWAAIATDWCRWATTGSSPTGSSRRTGTRPTVSSVPVHDDGPMMPTSTTTSYCARALVLHLHGDPGDVLLWVTAQ